MFAGVVGAHERDRKPPVSRRHVNQQSRLLLSHVWKDCTIDASRAKDIHVDKLGNLLDGEAFKVPGRTDARVVHDHIDAPCSSNDRLYRS